MFFIEHMMKTNIFIRKQTKTKEKIAFPMQKTNENLWEANIFDNFNKEMIKNWLGAPQTDSDVFHIRI